MKAKAIFKRIAGYCRTTRQQHALDQGDMLWLRWVVLSISVLFCLALLMACGTLAAVDQWHTELLQGVPFHLSANGAAAGSILSPVSTFACCIPLTLYWAAVMMHQSSLRHRTELTVAALLTLAFPGLLCVLWDSVLHTSALLCCVLVTWFLVICIPFFGKKRA